MAAYMIINKTNNKKCAQCADITRSTGPCATCIADGNTFKGACTNCHYKGRGANCSFVRDAEEAEAQEVHAARKRRRVDALENGVLPKDRLVITKSDLMEASRAELHMWRNCIDVELARRDLT